ncbi:Rap30/74 interaction domain-containing protein [Durotheca rogersii]|uniref:Rap30/74 interaction domain-containing protein n=1 Tax=Durotheca rogersii TaxID=419775 RepID=UPI00221E508A|nr:Rap30/74 interaction domain-containing protein [Durotheca rogersii]KAI5866472.1 Rap30/74 interaction domain-containing protein [Durotheca rogersii]
MSESASPSGDPNGQRPTPPGLPGAPLRRRPRPTGNPLVPRKRPVHRPPPSAAPPSFLSTRPNLASRPSTKPQAKQGPPDIEALRKQNDGWSTPKPPDAQEYPLFITKKSLKEGLRFHVMRLAPPGARAPKPGDPGVDPTSQNEFTRPVTLHRRDPRQPPPGRVVKEEPPPVEEAPVDTAEIQKLAQIKAEREAQRAADDALKAPTIKDPNPKGKQQKDPKKRHGMQIYYQPRTEKQKKESEIRYEEALPWHLEDADGKNVWVGQYEAPLSDCKVALIIHNGGFRIVPLEKWYKFTSKRGAFQALSIEEAEKAMNRKVALGRWAIRDTQRAEAEKAMAESRAIVNGRTAVKQESGTFKQSSRQEKMDHDDIDMSGDEFQDDDETAGYEPDRDEDTRQANSRIRRDQLNANLFGEADELKVEKDEADEQKEEQERKLLGKDLKKALKRRDKQFQYESDSSRDRDPFASSEDESDSDDDEKEDEEKKGDKDKPAASGTSSKGANTPQGKKAAAEAAKKGKSLKRAGSPMVSDSSGTESTRKKKKTTHTTSGPGSRGTTPLPGNQRVKPGAGSTSDGEGTAGEMSDGAGSKKKRLGPMSTSGRGTPAGSRAGSPAPLQGANPPTNRGATSAPRSNSPGAAVQSPTQEYTNTITPQEIVDALPPLPEGITIGALLKRFHDRVEKPGCMSRKEWLKLVKENANFNTVEKLLRRKA